MTPEQAEIDAVKYKLLGLTTCCGCWHYVDEAKACIRQLGTEGIISNTQRCGYYDTYNPFSGKRDDSRTS